jgi:hypothetical protein
MDWKGVMSSNWALEMMQLQKKPSLHGQVRSRAVLRLLAQRCPYPLFSSPLGGLQIGGGINEKNAEEWLKAGASKVRNSYKFGNDFG